MRLVTYILVGLIFGAVSAQPSVSGDTDSPLVKFGIAEIASALTAQQEKISVHFEVSPAADEQSYRLTYTAGQVKISGDELGVMYGALEVAEWINTQQDLEHLNGKQGTPYLHNRGLKFNIPLDARAPSYDDTGDAAQRNILHMWDMTFWRAFFDRMARYRYNVLSLWSPNPFQVMTKLPNYPELALDDVYVTTLTPQGPVGEWGDAGGLTENVLSNLKKVKTITIDEKIAFWNQVFDYAKSRGVNIYLYTWNIYTNGTYGQYGLSDDIDNSATKAYYREAIRVFLETYPQVKGIGITAGERMEVGEGKDVADERERWLWETYGLGILDYKKDHPERTVNFVHRVWYSKFDQIMKYWSQYPDPFDVGFKYVKARIYSSPQESPFIGGLKKGLEASNLKCWWNLRNDDIFVYRWGDPDYVRTFISNLPDGITAGYHMGADGYVFGRVFSDKNPSIQGTMELDKHWYKFMLWGRLGYDNSIPNKHLASLLKTRYQVENEQLLMDVWQTASKVIPQVNRFTFHTGDRHWAPEMCASRETFRFTPFFRVPRPMPHTGILSPKDFVAGKSGSVGPLQIADSLMLWGDQVLTRVDQIKGVGYDLPEVKNDMKAFAWLGKYYAYKIKAAVLMERMTTTHQPSTLEVQLQETMREATECWLNYARLSEAHYRPQMYARVQKMDWQKLTKMVQLDEELVVNYRSTNSLPSMLQMTSPKVGLEYPVRGSTKHVLATIPKAGEIHLALYDDRDELVNYYVHQGVKGANKLVWEDLSPWYLKSNHTLVLLFDGMTQSLKISK
ncbi:hypothetical protein C7460_11661 [Marinoscillum furvescens DSM 4134]|uniref:Glycosyl hydrolase family 115 (Putative glucuronidase) n=2 Tax=Marinoscillum furvescens TaxID=1026 RepID=A0A3D9L1H8_MARFU|nr:hypothetical protein C7460_11661 [Marinoscillum furvescens DSM 4134]